MTLIEFFPYILALAGTSVCAKLINDARITTEPRMDTDNSFAF